MDSMINRAMLSNNYSFYKTALVTSLKFASVFSLVFFTGLLTFNLVSPISEMYFILGLIVILQIPISSLEKIECGLLGLNKFNELIFYKLLCSFVSISPLIGSLFKVSVLWIISLIIFTRLIVIIISVLYLKNIIFRMNNSEESENKFYINEAIKMSWLSGFATLLNYIWPLLLFKIDPISLSVYFNGNKIPEKVKDYSKLFISVPSQHWLKKGKGFFIEKIKEKGFIIFGASLLFAAFLIITAHLYIPFVFGVEYEKSIYIAQIILLGVPARVLSAILQSREIFHEDDTSFFRKSNYILSIFNLILAVPMVYFFKEIGLAFHNLILAYLSYLISLVRLKFFEKSKMS